MKNLLVLIIAPVITLASLQLSAAQPAVSQEDINKQVESLLADMTVWVDQAVQVSSLPEKMNCHGQELVDLNTIKPAYIQNLGKDSWKDEGRYQVNARGSKVFANFNDGDQYYGLLFRAQDLKSLKSRRTKSISAYEISGFEHGEDYFSLASVKCSLSK